MAKPASGQITPRTSQCAGALDVAATAIADSIFTSLPNLRVASSSHFSAGALADSGAHTIIVSSSVLFIGSEYNTVADPPPVARGFQPVYTAISEGGGPFSQFGAI